MSVLRALRIGGGVSALMSAIFLCVYDAQEPTMLWVTTAFVGIAGLISFLLGVCISGLKGGEVKNPLEELFTELRKTKMALAIEKDKAIFNELARCIKAPDIALRADLGTQRKMLIFFQSFFLEIFKRFTVVDGNESLRVVGSQNGRFIFDTFQTHYGRVGTSGEVMPEGVWNFSLPLDKRDIPRLIAEEMVELEGGILLSFHGEWNERGITISKMQLLLFNDGEVVCSKEVI